MIPRHRDADKIAVPDDFVGRIKIYPPRARKVNLQPRMGRAAADSRGRLGLRYEDVAADEPGR